MSDFNKTVLITGAGSGIGKEISLRFAKEGWKIICHYNSSEREIKELERLIKRHSGCYLLKADFRSKKQVHNFMDKVSKFNIASLINNAGSYAVNKYFGDLELEDIEDTFMINVFTPILLASRLFSKMKKNKFGRIINISSIAAKYGGSSFSLHYGCSKLALEGLTKTLAKEGAGHNILVNTLRPGVIDTEFHKKFPKDMARRIEMIPLKKIGAPQDVADIAYYLGSEKNNFITNEIIAISGGE